MKTPIIIIILLLAYSLQGQITFNPGDLDAIVQSEKKIHAGKLDPRAQSVSLGYDVTYYRCQWEVDPAVKYIAGKITTLFKPTISSFDSLKFDLSSVMTVDSVIYHNTPLPFNHLADYLTIVFPSIIGPGIPDSVSVFYHGVPPDAGFGYFEQSTHNDVPIIWTLSEPYGARDWWPCKDGLTDKADSLDVYITTPLAYKAASNGLLISLVQDGIHHTFHWSHRYPIATYLVCLAVTNYVEYSHKVPFNGDTLNVLNYVYPEDSLTISSQTGVIVALIQLFDTLFGVYPFQKEKYGHVQFGWGGGMEHQTFTFVGSFGYELLAHELAHSWFGDKVTCASWSEIWLNEGPATYLSGLSYEHLLPQWWIQFKKVRISSIISKPDGSVWCDDTLNIDRVFDGRLSYAKGAMILNQLRWIIGDPAFFSAMNNYLDNAQCSYGFAHTSDLKSQFEASYGQDLTWYFDDWYTGQGYPSYDVNWRQTGSEVNLTIHQTQSHGSVSFFELPVPLLFKNQSQDTLIRFSNTFSGQTFTASIPFAVDTVLIDPDYWLISGNNVTSAVHELEFLDETRIYPNPAVDFITVALNDPKYSLPYVMYATDGKSVKQGVITQAQNRIDIRSLPNGLYSLLITGKDRSRMCTFLKN
ncbi:MAG: M1 family aminopeptidase [Bacteroidales bacterium]